MKIEPSMYCFRLGILCMALCVATLLGCSRSRALPQPPPQRSHHGPVLHNPLPPAVERLPSKHTGCPGTRAEFARHLY